MQAYLPEKIGNPELFSGRKKELEFFQKWIQGIPKSLSRSYALLSRRKTGKTAIMQRLYNQPTNIALIFLNYSYF